MTQPYPGLQPTPPPTGVPARELVLARFRSSAGGLFFSAVVLIAAAGAAGYFTNNLPAPFENWMLWAGAAVLVLFLVFVPFLRWVTRRYTITSRRVIAESGVLRRRREEMSHAAGYAVRMQRSLWQRMGGRGTLLLVHGGDPTLRLVNIRHARLVNETLVDQLEVDQIQAHRESQVPLPPLP